MRLLEEPKGDQFQQIYERLCPTGLAKRRYNWQFTLKKGRLENTTSGDPHRQWENLVTKVWKSEYGFFYFSFSEAQQLPL
ncbi:hypothetical protein NL676_009509 [Syzygium grande]|nr:hypothetical protein NL676_009509 [Syzygium grande]